jgi:hypothetical protein
MRDSNLPKFLAPDAELFLAIVGDLFPGLDVPDQVGRWPQWGLVGEGVARTLLAPGLVCRLLAFISCLGVCLRHESRRAGVRLLWWHKQLPAARPQDQGDLEGAVRGALAASGLQAPPAFVAKALQLAGTLDVRFGVMLVRGGTQPFFLLLVVLRCLGAHGQQASLPAYQTQCKAMVAQTPAAFFGGPSPIAGGPDRRRQDGGLPHPGVGADVAAGARPLRPQVPGGQAAKKFASQGLAFEQATAAPCGMGRPV